MKTSNHPSVETWTNQTQWRRRDKDEVEEQITNDGWTLGGFVFRRGRLWRPRWRKSSLFQKEVRQEVSQSAAGEQERKAGQKHWYIVFRMLIDNNRTTASRRSHGSDVSVVMETECLGGTRQAEEPLFGLGRRDEPGALTPEGPFLSGSGGCWDGKGRSLAQAPLPRRAAWGRAGGQRGVSGSWSRWLEDWSICGWKQWRRNYWSAAHVSSAFDVVASCRRSRSRGSTFRSDPV